MALEQDCSFKNLRMLSNPQAHALVKLAAGRDSIPECVRIWFQYFIPLLRDREGGPSVSECGRRRVEHAEATTRLGEEGLAD